LISARHYAEKDDSKQGFPHTYADSFFLFSPAAMQYPKPISELIASSDKRLDELSARLARRAAVLAGVRAALAPSLAAHVASAGLEAGRLSIGVASGAWATRLRYSVHAARARIAAALGTEITRIRIRVLPPP
jgi:Dna[CI] antecedent, DciA